MRILYALSENLDRRTGGIVHFLAVARGLKKLGHQVTILGPQYSPSLRRPRDLSGVYIRVPGRNMLSFLLFQVQAALCFPVMFLLHRPQTLMVRGASGLMWLLQVMAKLFGVAVVQEVNGLPYAELESRGFPKWLARGEKLMTRLFCRTSDRIITVTRGIGEELVRVFSVAPERVFPVPNGADPDELRSTARRATREKMGFDDDCFVVGFIGSFTPWHGVTEMIESAALLSPETRRRVRYVMVGHGDYWEHARGMIEDRGLGDVIRLPGLASRREVADLLAAFDIGIYIRPTRQAQTCPGSPLKFWEYLAAALPVIVTDGPHLGPIVERFEMGMVIPDASPRHIAAGVEEACARREQLKETGRRNLHMVVEQFSWLNVSRRVARVLDLSRDATDYSLFGSQVAEPPADRMRLTAAGLNDEPTTIKAPQAVQ